MYIIELEVAYHVLSLLNKNTTRFLYYFRLCVDMSISLIVFVFPFSSNIAERNSATDVVIRNKVLYARDVFFN